MRITNKFTIAVHVLACIAIEEDTTRITSEYLAGSINTNPVIVRTVLSRLREAGLVQTRRGTSGVSLTRPLAAISFLDICNALSCFEPGGLFNIHKDPNPECPVGSTIHDALADKLARVETAIATEMNAITMDMVMADIVANTTPS